MQNETTASLASDPLEAMIHSGQIRPFVAE